MKGKSILFLSLLFLISCNSIPIFDHIVNDNNFYDNDMRYENKADENVEDQPLTKNEFEIITSPGVSLPFTEIALISQHMSDDIQKQFTHYTQIIAPNGNPINIFAQDEISEVQIIHARNVLLFYLTDVPNSKYGADKSEIANQMAQNHATLILLNGADNGRNPAVELDGQPLFDEELIVPGSTAYMNNDCDHRDATYEEILHLVHDTGIGVDGENAYPGVLPAYQLEIRAAMENAIANNYQIWPISASYDADDADWFQELKEENSLTQEYLVAVVDGYYGQWAAFNERDGGMWGLYIAKSRDEIKSKDPHGWSIMQAFFSPYLTYFAVLDPTFTGTFSMTYDRSNPYTTKSQYLINVSLSGTNNANLTGNDQNNHLTGNSGDNILDGLSGDDSVIYSGNMQQYEITKTNADTIQVIGDGIDTLINIEEIIFADQTVYTADITAK